jgi:predicted ester cyclase
MVDTAMPDQAGQMEALIAEGDTVVGRWMLRGTHTGGPFLSPTDRQVSDDPADRNRTHGGGPDR